MALREWGGCTYCNDRSLYPVDNPGSLREQIIHGMDWAMKKYKSRKFIIYFQSNTNTYASAEYLRSLYLEALTFPQVVGIAIGTRPDCVSEDCLDMIEELSRRTYIWMEYGLQSASDETLKQLKRGHTLADFTGAVLKTHKRNIEVCAHIIIGLPDEKKDDIIRTVSYLTEIKIDGIKIHAFHILRDTPLEKWYYNNAPPLMGMEEYAHHVADVLERLPANVVIHRLTGEAPQKFLVAPEWVKNKSIVLNRILDIMKEKKTFQGKYFMNGIKRFC